MESFNLAILYPEINIADIIQVPYILNIRDGETKSYEYTIGISLLQQYIDFSFTIKPDKQKILCEIIRFYTYPSHKGIGGQGFAFMLNKILQLISENKTEILIYGNISTEDSDGWPEALLAYKKLADTFGLTFYIRDSLTKEKYVSYDEIEKLNAGNLNDSIFYYSGHKLDICPRLLSYKKHLEKDIEEIRKRQKPEIEMRGVKFTDE